MKVDLELKLVPLRVPTGWAIKFNKFWEIKPFIENGSFVNSEDFSEDLLSIERICPDNSNWPCFILDLGWYPAEDYYGYYKLDLIKGSSDNILRTFEAKNYNDIRETIEQWLDILSKYYYDDSGIHLLKENRINLD